MRRRFISGKAASKKQLALRIGIAMMFIILANTGVVMAYRSVTTTSSLSVAQYGDTSGPTVGVSTSTGLLSGGKVTIRVSYSDPSGINTGSVNVTVDGRPVSCSVTSSSATCSASGLFLGFHTVGGSVSDKLGNTSAIRSSFLTLL